MKNPISSVKRLRNRVFPRRRQLGDVSSRSLTPEQGTPSDETEEVRTPVQTATEMDTSNDADVSAALSPENDSPTEAKKVRGKFLQRGKDAVAKSVSFVEEKVTTAAAVAKPVPRPEKEMKPESSTVAGAPTVNKTTAEAPRIPPIAEEGTQTTPDETANAPVAQAVADTGTEAPAQPNAAASANAAVSDAPAQQTVYDVHARTVLLALLGLVTGFWFLVIAWLGVSRWETAQYSLLTFAATLAYCYFYWGNVRQKRCQCEVLDVTPGVVGMKALLGELPTWLSYTKKDRVEWLNKCLKQMWPAYDKAVCEAIKESVEPIVQSVKPPIFKDIRFMRLRFGDVPFRVEGVEIYDITESEMVIDIDIRWCGDSNVTLAIEPNIPSMTDITRMQPKVRNISCYGTLRLIFKPLVPEIPGFGAIIATFVRTPTINFDIDLGRALGGSVSGKMVKTALDSFIRETLVNMYVWPKRYVIPMIYDEAITGRIEDLELRHVGVLTVKVLEARDLPAADMNGFSDPTLELWTRPERKYNTTVMKKTLNPVWQNEVHHLLVQEPRSQNLSITAFDVDFLNVSDVLKSVNIVKNLRESVNAKEFLGRASIPLRPVTEQPGRVIDQWYDLGANVFGHPDGPGSGCGSFHLQMIYTPFSMLKTDCSTSGVVLVTVIRCRDLMAMDRGGTSDPYVKIRLKDTAVKTHVVSASCDPEFHVDFEFFDVPITETLHFDIFDKDFASRDDPLGSKKISVKEVASSAHEGVPGHMRGWFALDGVQHGDVQLKLQYIPLDTTTPFAC